MENSSMLGSIPRWFSILLVNSMPWRSRKADASGASPYLAMRPVCLFANPSSFLSLHIMGCWTDRAKIRHEQQPLLVGLLPGRASSSFQLGIARLPTSISLYVKERGRMHHFGIPALFYFVFGINYQKYRKLQFMATLRQSRKPAKRHGSSRNDTFCSRKLEEHVTSQTLQHLRNPIEKSET